MPGATLTTVDQILKEIYGPRIEEQLQNEVVALKRIERSSDGINDTVGGKYVTFPIHVTRNHGIGSRGEDDPLPPAGNQGYAKATVGLKYQYGRVRFTGQVMRLAEKNHQAFAGAMDEEMEGLKDDLVKDCNRQVYGDSTGTLTTFTGAATGANFPVNSTQYLEVGMIVDATDSAGADLTNGNQLRISSIDTAAKTIQLVVHSTGVAVSGLTTTATSLLTRHDSYGKEILGLKRIIDDSATGSVALHGITPNAQPKWKAVVKGNSGTNRALSEGLMIETVDDIRVNGGRTSVILTSLGVRRAYFNLLTQQRRYADTKEFAGGFTGLAFNHGREIPVVEDVDAPPNKMYFLDEKTFTIYRDKEWHWADDDGNVLKWVNGYDAWEAFMRQYWELGNKRRNANGVLQDITEG